MIEREIKSWRKGRLKKDCELMVTHATEIGGVCSLPVNEVRQFKAGTIFTFTGGCDTSYYLRLGEQQDPQIVIPYSELAKIELDWI